MSSIGGISVCTIQGVIEGLRETLTDITRPNVDGKAYRKSGQRPGLSRVETWRDCISAVEADSVISAMDALVGTSVTVVDDLGRTISYVVVLSVHHERIDGVAGAAGWGLINTNPTHMLRSVWELEMTTESTIS